MEDDEGFKNWLNRLKASIKVSYMFVYCYNMS